MTTTSNHITTPKFGRVNISLPITFNQHYTIMKKTWILCAFAIVSATATTMSSCTSKTGRDTSQTDSCLYLNDKIQVGDTAMSLVGKGILTPSADYEEYFDLMDKTFAGVEFDEARAVSKDKRIKCLSYISKSYKDKEDFLKDKNKLFVKLCKEYGKPSKDSSWVEKEDALYENSHDYIWESKSRVVSVTIHRKEWAYWLGGGTTYTAFAQVEIQDSVLQRKNLQTLSLKQQ